MHFRFAFRTVLSLSVVSSALALTLGCGSSPAPTPQTPAADPLPAEPMDDAVPERAALTQQQCEAQGGTIVGDIGDGATSRPDYVCPSGAKPMGNVLPPDGGPMPIEGSVCCPL